MSQLEPTPKELCCICKKDIAVMAFNKDWIHGCEAWTKDNQYSKDDRCCDLCNQGVVAKRLQDHKDDKISSLYSGAEDFLNEMGSDYDKY